MFNNDDVFVMFKNEFIKSKEIKNKLLMIMAYIRLNASALGSLGTSIDLLVKSIGYKPDNHKNRINDFIRSQMQWLERNNYIYILADINKVNSKECFMIKINDEHNIFDMNYDDNGKIKTFPFVMLTYQEFNTIVGSKTMVDKALLLRIFLVIKSHINWDESTANYTYISQDTVAKECNISSTGGTVNSAIKELVDLKILYEHITGSYLDHKNNRRNANNYYAVEKNQLDHNLCDEAAKQFLASRGITIDKFDDITKPNMRKKKSDEPSEDKRHRIGKPKDDKKVTIIPTVNAVPGDVDTVDTSDDILNEKDNEAFEDLLSGDDIDIFDEETVGNDDVHQEQIKQFQSQFGLSDAEITKRFNAGFIEMAEQQCEIEADLWRKKNPYELYGMAESSSDVIPESLKITKELIKNQDKKEMESSEYFDGIDIAKLTDDNNSDDMEVERQRKIKIYGFDIYDQKERKSVVNSGISDYADDYDDLY